MEKRKRQRKARTRSNCQSSMQKIAKEAPNGPVKLFRMNITNEEADTLMQGKKQREQCNG